jgi:multimeric flavodoxin WrbA
MVKISIVYFTKTDITGALVRSLASALKADDVTVFLHKIEGAEIVEGRFSNIKLFETLNKSDAIIFATPTYMGGPSAQFKAFVDASSNSWTEQEWSGKIAAGLTSGGALNGDQSSTIQYLSSFAAQHGMLWVGLDAAPGYKDKGINRLGYQLGVVSHSKGGKIHDVDRESAIYLGKRVLTFVKRLKNEI